MNPQTRETLLEFVRTNTVTSNPITNQTDLIQNEIMDSLMLMELVLFVEQSWGVQLMGNDFAPNHFRTVEQLAQLVDTRRLSQSA